MASQHWTAGDDRPSDLATKLATHGGPDRCTEGPDGGPCPRCTGAQPGNQLAAKHGAYSLVEIEGRAIEVAEGLREALTSERLYRPSFEPMITLASLTMVRVERAALALAEVDATVSSPLAAYHGPVGESIEKLRKDLGAWTTRARNALAELGLTPSALTRLAKDAGQAGRAAQAIAALNEHLAEHHVEANGR